ncbi:hypothetical protein KDK95_02260 [Actinospica sp. MGRD01-02]|uniref:DUF4430 domain-containing protein n=1 Tax=Actinospica acidithermotolerans TaxID=2828514 RepID=A0A941E9P4_9ACTN|nr:hypothetical protein [Actinospica acidithermotolerans]MBR7825114.1 hypothetical protein [Actinospica acidithermotolerans]
MRSFGSVLRKLTSGSGRRVLALSAAVIALVGLTAATAGTASAAAAPHTVRVTVQMHVVGFNATVARAHGYLVKTAPDGHQYAVAKGANSAVVPNTTVPGNCGTATMDYTAIGGKAANVYTGFTVDDGAWLFSWNVSVTDNAGVGNESWGDYLASDHQWYTTWETHHSVTGYSWAEVTSGAAFLDNGTTCEAANVSASTNLY